MDNVTITRKNVSLKERVKTLVTSLDYFKSQNNFVKKKYKKLREKIRDSGVEMGEGSFAQFQSLESSMVSPKIDGSRIAID
jgi:hypothetical protein